MSIENTQDPASRELTTLLMLATGDTDAVIGAQERAGQSQLVHSDRLPTDIHGNGLADFEAVGFTFGEPDSGDPLFMPATLPDGWRKEASDHDMWSYIVDGLGRRRVGVFYKAAFYDRKAHMSLVSLSRYVSGCVYDDKPIVLDDTWATREAVHETCLAHAKQAEERVETWQGIAGRDGEDEMHRTYIAEYTAERDKYEALARQYAAE